MQAPSSKRFSSQWQVGITLQDALPNSPAQAVLILKNDISNEAGGLAWTSYDTGSVVEAFSPEMIPMLAKSNSLAVTGKVLAAALEAFPELSRELRHIKVFTAKHSSDSRARI